MELHRKPNSSAAPRSNPSIAVIIPHYSATATIRRAVRSVLDQTVLPSEIIVVDDASATHIYDELLLALSDFGDSVITLRLTDNGGPAAARNAGWEAATTEYVAFLDADDSWLPTKLAGQTKLIRHFGLDLLGGPNAPQSVPEPSLSGVTPSFRAVSRNAILLRNPFSTSSVVVRRNMPLRFDSARRYAEDYELWLRIVLGGARAGQHTQAYSLAYKSPYGESGLSANLWKMSINALDVFYRAWRRGELSFLRMSMAVLWSLIRSVRRYVIVAVRRAASVRRRGGNNSGDV